MRTLTGIEGSNPSLSAILQSVEYQRFNATRDTQNPWVLANRSLSDRFDHYPPLISEPTPTIHPKALGFATGNIKTKKGAVKIDTHSSVVGSFTASKTPKPDNKAVCEHHRNLRHDNSPRQPSCSRLLERRLADRKIRST